MFIRFYFHIDYIFRTISTTRRQGTYVHCVTMRVENRPTVANCTIENVNFGME